MACKYCMEEPEEGRCIRNGCAVCCNCDRLLHSTIDFTKGFTQTQMLDTINIEEIKSLRAENKRLRDKNQENLKNHIQLYEEFYDYNMELRDFAKQVMNMADSHGTTGEPFRPTIIHGFANRARYLLGDEKEKIMHPRNPYLATDIIIELPGNKIVLIKRKNPPHGWSLPGGFVEYGESVEAAAVREAKEETSLDVTLAELFHVYSAPDRDPRQHIVSVVYIAAAVGEPKAADDAKEAGVFDPNDTPPLVFDHEKIIKDYLMFKKTLEQGKFTLEKRTIKCPVCNGEGKYSEEDYHIPVTTRCWKCEGVGTVEV